MTIFDSPFITAIMRPLSLTILKMLGWNILGKDLTIPKKSVVVAYPHTSASDLPYTIMVAFALRLRIKMVTKRELFSWGLGPVLRFLGCVPVTRGGKLGATDELATLILREQEKIHLVIAPTGTRKVGTEWKTGFLSIAREAKVRLLLATINREKKEGGVFHIYHLCGDTKKDLAFVQQYYADRASPHRIH